MSADHVLEQLRLIRAENAKRDLEFALLRADFAAFRDIANTPIERDRALARHPDRRAARNQSQDQGGSFLAPPWMQRSAAGVAAPARRRAMTRQQVIIGIAVVAGQLLQPYVYKYLIAPPGRFIERIVRTRLRRWPAGCEAEIKEESQGQGWSLPGAPRMERWPQSPLTR